MKYNYHVAVYNRATTPLGLDLDALLASMRIFLDKFFTPAWGISATLRHATGPSPGCLSLVFMDNADSPGALAYHDEETGLPMAKVFVETVKQNSEPLSVATSHELLEMLVDPSCCLYSLAGDGATLYPYEVADAVEETYMEIAGFPMTDFVLPAWFDAATVQKKFDWMGVLQKPFQLAAGGYAQTLVNGNQNTVFGSANKAAAFAKEDRRGHRSEYRRKA